MSNNSLLISIPKNNVIWNGSTDMVWTAGIDTTSWSSQTYRDGYNAYFNGAGPGTVTINGTVAPKSTYLTSGNYTLSGILGGGALYKSGPGTVTLGGGVNTFIGNITLSGGTLNVSSDDHLGYTDNKILFTNNSTLYLGPNTIVLYNRDLSISPGITGTLTSGFNAKTFAGILSGSGILLWPSSTDLIFSNLNNSFAGTIYNTGPNTSSYGIQFASLADNPGNGNIILGSGTNNATFYWRGPTKTFSNRTFVMGGTTGGAFIMNNNASSSDTLTINTNLSIGGTGNKTLTLGGTNAGNNTFGGVIADGVGSIISLSKLTSQGTWILTNNNTYSGNTNIIGNLVIGDGATSGSISSFSIIFGLGGLSNNLIFNRSDAIVYSATISGDGVVNQNGSGSLRLTGTNTYTAGTKINNGRLSTRVDANLGTGGGITANNTAYWNMGDAGTGQVTYARALTVNGTLYLESADDTKTISGVVSGPQNASLIINRSTWNTVFSNTGNTYTGTLTVANWNISNPNANFGLSLGNIGDSVSSIILGSRPDPNIPGDSEYAGWITWTGGAKTFVSRTFVLAGGAGAGGIIQNDGSGAIIIQKPLSVTSSGNKNLVLRGTNTNNNNFSGNISDGSGAVISILKQQTGTWFLSGTNTYTGNTSIANGILAVTKFVSGSSKLTQANFQNNLVNCFLGLFFNANPILGETYRIFPGSTVQTINSANITIVVNGVTVSRTASYNSNNSTVTITN